MIGEWGGGTSAGARPLRPSLCVRSQQHKSRNFKYGVVREAAKLQKEAAKAAKEAAKRQKAESKKRKAKGGCPVRKAKKTKGGGV